MSSDIALVLAITLGAIILFMSGRLRVDLVALVVLSALVLFRLISPQEAVSGFSNPAVITVWAVFILSGGLTNTGVADLLGNQVLKVAGDGRDRLLLLIMFTAAILSSFMNNVGVAALLLPVVIEIARKTGTPTSKLLLPLAFGSLLGGMVTLIGTPPNILASDALRDAGFQPFEFFDFAPVGLIVMFTGILFLFLIGHRLLPDRDPASEARATEPADLEKLYSLQEEFLILRIPKHSTLAGMNLQQSQIGSMLGLNVIAIIRNGRTQLSPPPFVTLETGDRLVVVGDASQLRELRQHKVETLQRTSLSLEQVREAGMDIVKLVLLPGAPELDQTLEQVQFRSKLGLNVLAVQRDGTYIRERLNSLHLECDDILLVEGPEEKLSSLQDSKHYRFSFAKPEEIAQLDERLLLVCIPSTSTLVGKHLNETNLGEAFGLTVLRIAREADSILLPGPEVEIHAADLLLVQGSAEDISSVRGLERLEVDLSPLELKKLETSEIGLMEAVLSPHSTFAGKSLAQLKFREKFGLNVLAIMRAGETIRHDLADLRLRFGDGFLLHGSRQRFVLLATEPDFIVLNRAVQEPPNVKKAPVAIFIMGAVLIGVVVGWLPIAVAAVVGGTLMVLTKCLSMEEAYTHINWPAVFLIATMLPLGLAMENTGATQFLTDKMMQLVGNFGPLAVLAGLFLFSVLASQVIPNAAVVVLMAPIAISTAIAMDVSPKSFMMGIAIAASASFLSPVSHPANVLVMGPGGYRFLDYIKVGLPLTILVLLVTLTVLPLVWPFR